MAKPKGNPTTRLTQVEGLDDNLSSGSVKQDFSLPWQEAQREKRLKLQITWQEAESSMEFCKLHQSQYPVIPIMAAGDDSSSGTIEDSSFGTQASLRPL